MKDDIESQTQDIQRCKELIKLYSKKAKSSVHYRTGKPMAKKTIRLYRTKINALNGLIVKLEEMINEAK